MSCEPILAYFDTNVFDNLLKKTGGVTETDLARIHDLVASGRLKIISNILNIQETIAAQHKRPEIVRPQLDLIASLSDWARFVKPHCFILEDDIRHFASNGERASPFEKDNIVAKIRTATLRGRDNNRFESLASEDQQQKTRFLGKVMRTRDEVAPQIEEFRKEGEVLTFGQYFEESAGDFALAFARSFGVSEQCERRGVENLLKDTKRSSLCRPQYVIHLSNRGRRQETEKLCFAGFAARAFGCRCGGNFRDPRRRT